MNTKQLAAKEKRNNFLLKAANATTDREGFTYGFDFYISQAIKANKEMQQ